MKIPKISFEREGHPAPAADRLNGFARRQGFPRSRRQMLVAVLLPILAFIGCAREPGKTGFPAVQTAARNRIGKEIRWKDAAGEESAIAERVKELLAGELNADAAVQVALLNNRRMQALYEDLEIAQADLVQASLLPNPIAEGSLKASTNGGASPEIELGVVENFVSILTIPLKRKIAKAEFESVKAHVTQEVLALASEVRGQFYVVQADHQMIEMLGHVTETTGASLDAARRLHEAGNIRDLDLSAEEAVDAQARLDLAEAEVKAMKNRERLNILLGLWGEEAGLEVSTRLADVPDEELPADDVEKR
ncbi:TolC family protein, partial [Candidatus Sumerlaeota bacterium]|nr:TolC family protein [Candidatus Sumerlaeota bacterium]